MVSPLRVPLNFDTWVLPSCSRVTFKVTSLPLIKPSEMNANSMTVRAKVAIELGIIAVLTIAFLLLFPRRNPWLDVGLAGFALACIGASAGYTRKVVWA